MVVNPESFEQIIGQSVKIKEVVEQAKKFANLDAPLLIQGETGTGKDYLPNLVTILDLVECKNLLP